MAFNPDQWLQLDQALLVLLVVLLGEGLVLVFLGLKRYFKGRFISASLQSLSGLLLISSGLLLLSVGFNLLTYQRLSHEQTILTITFKQLAPQRYQVMLNGIDSDIQRAYVLQGDEWQLDARVIKWHPLANILGFDTHYRLERLSGRYQDIREEEEKPRSVYALSEKDSIDFWQLINKYRQYLPWVDAYYGSATYLPMSNNARYIVSVSQSGLLARPGNTKTQESIRNW